MQQVIIAGYANALNASSTEYNSLSVGGVWGAQDEAYQVFSCAGTLKKLRVTLSDDPGASGDTYTFTVMKGTSYAGLAATDISVAIVYDATTGYDDTHTVSVSAGDCVSLRCVPTDSPTNTPNAQWSCVFEPSTDDEFAVLSCCHCLAYTTKYVGLSSGVGAESSTEANVSQPMPTDGTLKNLYVRLESDPGTDPDGYIFTVRVNGEDSDLTVAIVADDTAGADTTHTVSVSQGDIVSISATAVESASARDAGIGVCFVPDTSGESVILGATSDSLSNSATEYITPSGTCEAPVWTATEANVEQLVAIDCKFEKLYVVLNDAPGSSKSYTFTLRDDSGDSDVVTVLSDSETEDDSGALIDTIDAGSSISLKCVPSGTPTATVAKWSVVSRVSTSYNESATVYVGMDAASASRATTSTRSASDTVGISASASRAIAIARSASDTVGLTATASRVYGAVKSAAVSIGQAVSASRAATYSRSASASVGVDASATRVLGSIRAASVAIGESVTATAKHGYGAIAAVAIGVAVTASRSAAFTRVASTEVGVSATATAVSAFIRTAAVSIGLVVTVWKGFAYSASVALGVVATATRAIAVARSASDTVGVTATATRAIAVARSASDTVGVTASATRSLAYARSATKTVGLVASAVYAVYQLIFFGLIQSRQDLTVSSTIRSDLSVASTLRNDLTVESSMNVEE